MPLIEIIGTGYGKEVEIGESYLKVNVINMWDFPPKDAYKYYKEGSVYTLERYTKTSENGYEVKHLSPEEINDDIIETLNSKGYTLIPNQL
jgi:hypothetical protein